MSFVMDICTLAVFLIFLFVGYKNGFLRSVLGVISTVVSFFISTVLSNILSRFVYDKFLLPGLQSKIDLAIQNAMNEGTKLVPSDIINILPKWLRTSFNFLGLSEKNIYNIINQQSGNMKDELLKALTPVIIPFIRFIIIITLFFIFSILFQLLVNFVDRMVKLPIIKGLNSFLGMMLGAIKFFIIMVIFISAIKFLQPFMANDSSWIFSEEMIDNTLIFSKMYNNKYYNLLEIMKRGSPDGFEEHKGS